MTLPPGDILDLLDWKRRVSELYVDVRRSADPFEAWSRWREAREDLFASHPQSPVPEASRSSFRGSYFEYDPAARVRARVSPSPPEPFEILGSAGESFSATRFGTASFALDDHVATLDLFWLAGYAGGLFLSFRDATSGADTYGAGRYLLDTVKGSDLGMEGDRLVLDFNFAYNPSCAYDPRWACPLAPQGNRVPFPIEAGERTPELSSPAL